MHRLAFIGRTLEARADSQLVTLFSRGQLVKIHPRQPPGGRWTDSADLPAERVGYAMRDLGRQRTMASGHGDNIGIYAARMLDDPLPWTRDARGLSAAGLGSPLRARPGGPRLRDLPKPGRRLGRQIDAMLVKALERATPALPAAGGHPAGREPNKF